ncbi:MAG: SH3 domain-containing protein [Anaerolineae bacterium]|nr:SH3 domain-containing protein [Anaerolineae bacterium]
MGGDSDNFLPPWLRGADEPDDKPGTRQEHDPVEPAEIADQPAATDDLVPPWLREQEQAPELDDDFAQTMGLPKEFLDSADTLPDTAHTDLSYDEWLRIQQEANREHSVEEEVPDLLADDTAPTSPFFSGTVKPAGTGELPDWFLGLEELDESQAPEWFVRPEGETPPPASAVQDALAGLSDSDDDAYDDADADDEAWELPIDPEDVGDVSLDPFANMRESNAAAFTAEPSEDDAMASFFDGISRQRHDPAAPEADDASDWSSQTPTASAMPDDDFYAEYASLDEPPDEQSTAVRPPQREDRPTHHNPVEESLLDTNPTPDENEVSNALHARDYDEPDLSAFSDVDIDDAPATSALPVLEENDEADLDSDSLNWLSEVTSMVNSVTRYPESMGIGFDDSSSTEETGEQTEQPYFFPDDEPEAETQAPDWLSELQNDDSDQPETDDQRRSSGTSPARSEAVPSRPVIDFSTMDFDAYEAEDAYAEPTNVDDDTYDDLFANLQKQPEDSAPKPGNTSGATVILSPDAAPSEPESQVAQEAVRSSHTEQERFRALVTDELDAMLFGEEVASARAASNRAPEARETDSRSEFDDDYLILEQLSESASSSSPQTATGEDDLAWLSNVSFDDAPHEQADAESVRAPKQAQTTVNSAADVSPQAETRLEFGELDAATQIENPSPAQADDLRSLLDNLGASQLADDPDAAFDAMFSDVEAAPVGGTLDSESHVRIQTAELNALFGDSEPGEEDTSSASEDASPQSATMTGSPAYDAWDQVTTQSEQLMPQNDDFDSVFGGMNEPPEDESESLPDGGLNTDDDGEAGDYASRDDDLDELFASLDASFDYPDEELPSTAPLGDESDAQGQSERVAADEDDLEALFAAFEDEHRDESAPQAAEADEALDFPDDDSFFAAMGLGAEPESSEAYAPPEAEAHSPPDADDDDTTGPDLDFLEGFGQPEMNKTTVISGEENTSMWEEPETTEDQPEVELPAVPAFAFDDSGLPTDSADQNDWFDEPPIDDFAPVPRDPDDFDQEMAELGMSEAQGVEDVPSWLQDIDASSLPAAKEETASEAAAALFGADAAVDNLEDFIAGLDAPEEVLPQRHEYAGPGAEVDDFDLDDFDQALSNITDNAVTPESSGLEQSDMLDELQASVGAVSAAALARQMKDRPEGELSERLQKLRKRSTDEVRAAQTGTQGDDLSKVLPGVDDALVPVPVTIDAGEYFSGVSLSDQQRAQVALLGELIGSGDEPIQMRGTNRLSAIDLTYEGMHLPDEEAEGERAAARPEAAPRRRVRRRRTYRIDRLLLTLLLAGGIVLPFFFSDFRIGALPPAQFALGSQESHAFDQIDKLEEYDLVMIGLEYGPASAGELDQMADSIVRHVLLRGARPVFVSGNAFGVLRAESFLDAVNTDRAFLQRINQRVPMEANVEYYSARFLPGGAVGLRAFSEASSGLLTYDINGQTEGLNLESLSNLALIIMVTDRAEDVRAYAEQIAPLASRPLVVGVSYAAAPLAEPYARNESAVRGLLVGYEDAYTYHTLLDSVDAVRRGVRPVRPTLIAPTPSTPDEAQEGAQTEGETTGDVSTTLTPGAEGEETGLETPTPAPEAESLPSALVISANGANLRSGPGTDFRVVAGMARNTIVTVLAYNDTGDWVNVRLDDETEGWVSSGLLVIVEETPAPDDEESGKRVSARSPLQQDEPEPTDVAVVETAAVEPDASALQWYGMTIGIVGAFLVIGFGALTGILRAIFLRRRTS